MTSVMTSATTTTSASAMSTTSATELILDLGHDRKQNRPTRPQPTLTTASSAVDATLATALSAVDTVLATALRRPRPRPPHTNSPPPPGLLPGREPQVGGGVDVGRAPCSQEHESIMGQMAGG